MQLTFSSPIQAADQGRRIISGVVVPFNKVGMTSVGPVIFERGSIAIHDGTKIKLLAQHRPDDVLGRAQSFQTTDEAIYGQFKVSASSKGTDCLIMAAEGLISSLSIGVEVIASKPSKDGTLYVQSAVMKEVSVVESPAFEDAIITKVLASEGEAELSDQTNQTESEAIVTDETPVPDAVLPESAPVEAVEASRPTIKAASPYITSTVRSPIIDKGSYAYHSVQAALGNDDSKLYIKAAADSISTNPGFSPIQYLSSFISNTNYGRPAYDACSKAALTSSGLTLSVPTLDTNASGVAPTVASNAESATPSNTGMVTTATTASVIMYAGQQTVTLPLIERSNPEFMTQLMIQLERAYLKATDAAVIAKFISGGTAATAAAGTTAAGLIAYTTAESAATYANTSYFASNLVVGTGQWANILGYTDSTGRSLYNAANPYNQSGNASVGSIKGNVQGLDLYVDVNAVSTSASNSMFLLAPEAITVYEAPTANFSVNVVSSMSVNLAIYGYMAIMVNQAAGIRKFVAS